MNNYIYRIRIVQLLLMMAFVVSFALTVPTQAAETATGKKPVMLGGAVDMTSYLASYDRPLRAGIQLAIQTVNRNGGVLGGRPLKITFYNMKANPAAGVRVVRRLITQQHVNVILHGFTSASTRAVQPIVANNKVLLITASVLPKNVNFVFSTITPAKYMVSTRLAYLKSQGINRIGVLHDGTPYNMIQLKILRRMAKDMGMNVVGVEQHSNDAVTLRPQIAALLNAGANAIVKLSAGPTTIVAAKALAQADTSAPLLASIDSLSTDRQAAKAYQHFASVMSGPQAYSVLPPSMHNPSLDHFMKLYRKSGQTEYDPTYMARGWDTVWLLVKAINKAGSVEGPALQNALEAMGPYQGASGTYNFSEDTHYGIHKNPFLLIGFDSHGNMKVIYNPEANDHG